MVKWLVWFPLRLLRWVLAAIGAFVLLLIGMIASPIVRPPEMVSLSNTSLAVDRSNMASLRWFSARDGTMLAYRHYPARGVATDQIAIVIHGSSGSSFHVHALSDALAARGVETFAPDIRGHGGSGARGDIAYVGQLEDDLADLVAEVRKTVPNAPMTLLGHSSGGAFALRVAGSPIQNLFARTVLLSPYLGYDAPTSRRDAGGWVNADVPRLLGLALLQRLGIICCESLPTVAFAVPPNMNAIAASTYSYRLMRNFGTSGNYRKDLEATKGPLALFSGTDDEVMVVDKYRTAMGERVPVKLIEGINHMGIVSDAKAVAAIADDVARAGAGS